MYIDQELELKVCLEQFSVKDRNSLTIDADCKTKQG